MKKLVFVFLVFMVACKVPVIVQVQNKQVIPTTYNPYTDSLNTATIKWRDFFADSLLIGLIDTALKNNYALLANAQDIEISKNNIRIKHSALLPNVSGTVGLGLQKVGRYTAQGAGNASTKMTGDEDVPDPIGDIFLGFQAGWEIDVWGKLNKAKKAAVIRYLKTVEGKNFITTNLVADMVNAYYELLALDNQLEVVKQAIELQKNQLDILKIQKESAAATELAVKQFEAQVYNSQSQQFDILQRISITENKLNYLLGRFPQPIARDKNSFLTTIPKTIQLGVPSQLLQNRPDIKQAELELEATRLDVQIARAEFLPNINITGIFGVDGFKPKYLLPTLQNLAFNFAGQLVAPLINRNAIIATFNTANAVQINALYDYQKTILAGYMEVYNEMNNINNLSKYYEIKNKEAQTLAQSVDIAHTLFLYARANYLEVLTVQKGVLIAKLELIEAKKNQFIAIANIYKALGGGWR